MKNRILLGIVDFSKSYCRFTPRPSSNKNDGEYNRGDNDSSINTSRNNKDHLFNENNDRDDQHPYDLTNTNNIIKSEWIDNDTDNDEYDRDSDEKEREDEISRISTSIQ